MKRIINIKTVLISALLLSFASYANAVDIPTVDDLNKQVPQLPNEKEPDASENLGEINKNVLILTASDLETTFSTKLTIESEDSGTIALPAKILLDTLKTFPEQPLTLIQTDRNTVEIIANNGKYAVAYVDGSEFPQAALVPDPKNTVI